MARTKNPTGFLDYLKTGEITEQFLEDYRMLCMKIYARSRLRVTYEDFTGFCIEKLLVSLPRFDAEKGSLPTYLFNLVLNESRRIYSKEKHSEVVEINPNIDSSPLVNVTDSLFSKVNLFALMAYQKGVWVNQKSLIADYMSGVQSPVMKSYVWYSVRNP